MFEKSDSDEDAQQSSGAAAHKKRMNVIANARRAETTSIYEEEMETFSRKRRRTSGENSSASEEEDEVNNDDGEKNDNNVDETAYEPAAKKGFAARMMEQMGYREGEGLGKHGQGRVDPVGLSTQRGRVGLGHESSKVVSRTFDEKWDEGQEEKPITEDVLWMPKCNDHDRENAATESESNAWLETGSKKLTLDDETEFCTEERLQGMLRAKDVFDHLSDRELREARTRANPYETIHGAFFQNRAAMKAANMDKVFDWLFSQEDPKRLTEKNPVSKKEGESVTPAAKPVNTDRDKEIFYFADVCAGPGGFSEYMLWRKGFYNTKGFGFTLAGKDDFKLEKFNASSPYFFEPFYGKYNDGDVMNPENIDSLENFIMKGTDGLGVHLMMADGGFSVEGQENIQEILSKRLYLCQLLVSLCIVREGGNFFCKLFDIFTPFSAGLIYLMYVCYDEICLHKPHTSRPANSERYIICKGLRREYSNRVKTYLKRVNVELGKLKDSGNDVVAIVPLEVMKEDEGFYNYLVDHNEKLAYRQEVYLKKYLSFAKNQGQIDRDQGDLRDKCMQYWEIPDKPRARKEDAVRYNLNAMTIIGQFCKKTLGDDNINAKMPPFRTDLFTNHGDRQLKYAEFACTLLSERVPSQPKLLVSKSRGVFVYDKEWKMFEDTDIRIPEKTILLVELTKYHTLIDEKNMKEYKDVVRIIDAAVLHGDDISNLTYANRMKAAEKFCKALHRVNPEVVVSVPVQRPGPRGRPSMERTKRTLRPREVVVAKTLDPRELLKNKQKFKHLVHRGVQNILFEENGHHLAVTAVRFARILKEEWHIGWSRTQRRIFAFQPNRSSVFEQDFEQNGCCAPFWDVAIMKRLLSGEVKSMQYIWRWESSLNDDYGPNVIFSKPSHQSGVTIAELYEIVDKNHREVIGDTHH